MTRYTKNANGHYLIHGHKYEMLEGSRAQVMHGTAFKTSGGLKKPDLLQNKCCVVFRCHCHGIVEADFGQVEEFITRVHHKGDVFR